MSNIIGISGQARTGKDTFADYLVKYYGFVKIGLADPMKRFCKEVFDFSDEQLYGNERDKADGRYFRGFVDPDTLSGNYLTPRYALQTLGTEWGRHCYHNIWIENGIRTAQKLLRGGCYYTPQEGLVEIEANFEGPAGVVFSDLRFRNEFAAVKEAGGKMFRILRPGYHGDVGIGSHASEAEQKTIDDKEFDLLVNNDSDLAHYYQTIDGIMGKVLKIGRRTR